MLVIAVLASGAAVALPSHPAGAAPPREAESTCGGGADSCTAAQRRAQRKVDVVLGLRRRQGALQRFAFRVSTPSSADYGRYLRPRELGRRFGARRATRRTVRSFLRRRGIKSAVDITRSFVEALVPARKVRRLFGDPDGRKKVPRALRRGVREVLLEPAGADQLLPTARLSGASSSDELEPPYVRTGTPAGCEEGRNATFPYPDSPVAGPAFTPNQLETAYGAAPLHSEGVRGRRVRAAVIISGFARRELRAFARCFGLSVPKTRLALVGRRRPSKTDGESALDLQMLALMAPGLESLTVYSVGPQLWPPTFSAVIDRRNAPGGRRPHVVSVSEGDCETVDGRAEVRLTEHVLAAAAATGITIAAGSGDSGSFCTEGARQGFYPSSSRWVTSVGGTALILDEGNRIVDEIPWNDGSFAPRGGAGGGGFSRYLSKPRYQRRLGSWGARRGYPDVALIADSYPGIVSYCNENARGFCDADAPGNPFQSGGGTSFATPLFVGLVALADQRLLAAGRPPLGFANPLLYRLGRSGGRGALRDVVEGSILFTPGYGCCDARPGYDLASGWGSVNAERLAALALALGPGS